MMIAGPSFLPLHFYPSIHLRRRQRLHALWLLSPPATELVGIDEEVRGEVDMLSSDFLRRILSTLLNQ